ncbi:acyl-CoA synthetase [Mycolicibacterium sp. GF69]|uniref:AMP-binding protein n=1 Tax=Mycolicibacterium sp. GF69 TaxID=2267251 RepID=UPI000DCBA1CA|nr:AMP-binding protein [Mycolicibacterium sp. GF69]RAV13489.1 acyl-CoA synthetase [Mycolicibacterium sp. GF69]
MVDTSVLTLLRERADVQPDDTVFTFIDYDRDWTGVTETLNWSQLYRRTLNVANTLRRFGSEGDRALILAPQGLDYIVAFLGAMQAGRVAVPLSVPLGGVSDERVTSVLRDATPAAVLTTSAVADTVSAFIGAGSDAAAPTMIEVDALGVDGATRFSAASVDYTCPAYLQYTSGSTRTPTGVVMSHKNIMANFAQWMSDYYAEYGKVPPPDASVVTWLPFYHDMGLYLGVFAPILAGASAVLTSPTAFLQRPARWMQLVASSPKAFTAAPNFAFELAVRKTSDEDMAGLDLSDVHVILTGSERVNPATLQRFSQRFARFNLRDSVVRPSYGLAEATLYVATRTAGEPPAIVRFDSEKLTAGKAERCASGGTPLVSYGMPESPLIRIVDADTRIECPAGTVGEIWVYGDNVATGYWHKPDESEATFGGMLVEPSPGTPDGPWLRTGDQGFVFDDELFVIGRIKDLLIVYGRNHSPDDIEATVQEISRSRCVAIAVPDRQTEKLVVIVEAKTRGSDSEASEKLAEVKRDVTSAISNSHGLSVADLLLVPPGSIPITTSGKVRRAACVEQYRQRQFARIDA